MSAQPQPLPVQPQKPQLKVVEHQDPKGSRAWMWLALLGIAAIGGGYYYMNRTPAPVMIQASRTAKVRSGSLSRTLRLSGTTAAESSVQLLVPQLPRSE